MPTELVSRRGWSAIAPAFIIWLGGMVNCGLSADVVLEQVISRESPLFRCVAARMTIGRDGFVYLSSESQGKGFCLRLSRDGRQKLGGEVIYAIHNVTANADGVIASANAHFNHSLNLYDATFRKQVAADDFLVNDQVGWDAPSHVEAGGSGDFYGIDQHRNRVVRVGVDGKVKGVLPIRAEHESEWGKPNDFRVCEGLSSFYWLVAGKLIRTRMDGTTVWSRPVPVQYRWDVGSYGGWDVDDTGNVAFIDGVGDIVQRLDPDGQPLAAVRLDMGDLKPTPAIAISALRVWGDEILVRRASATELFQVYDRNTGKRKHVESIEHEVLSVKFPSLVWTNGQQVPLSISFRGLTTVTPHFRVWITPFGLSDWTELARDSESRVTVPAEGAGLYQLKVSPEVLPRQTDGPSEFLVREIIEIRRPDSQGTIAVVTPLNRTHYSVQERIHGQVIARARSGMEKVEVRMRDRQSRQVIDSTVVAMSARTDSPGEWRGAFEFRGLRQTIPQGGEYQLEVEVPGLTAVPQQLSLGNAADLAEFRKILYGDYGLTSPQRNAWEAADAAVSHADRMHKLGINQFVNRTQQLSLDFPNDDHGRGLLNRVKERLRQDPLAVTSEKAEFGSAHHPIAGIYSANGWREFLILVYMDGGLPLGTGHDRRTAAQFAEVIQRFTESFWSYRGLTGWAWVANWWLYEPNAKFSSDDEKQKFEAALKQAQTGGWDPLLDRVEDRKFGFAVDAQGQFNKALEEVDRRMAERSGTPVRSFITATAGPYRRPEVLPEFNFTNIHEIDVHYQAEQITTPDWVPHGVDVSKRAGQPAWVHPELWNDFGTGEQILPLTWLAIVRGADGIGTSGTIPNWPNASLDPRLGYHGTTTVFRSLHGTIDDLSEALKLVRQSRRPWTDSDRIGIVVSPRQVKVETFGNGVGSPSFSRQFEAYQSFLYANCPARFVSLEEVRRRLLPGIESNSIELNRCFDALLVVGQTVELEPEWQSLLTRAHQAGVRVLVDGTCRPGIHPNARPLEISFNHIENEHSANSDYAHWIYPARFRENAVALARIINELKTNSRRPRDVVTLADTADGIRPVVIVQEHPAEQGGTIVSVVNNTPTSLPLGQLRRVGRVISTRTPATARLRFQPAADQNVFDLFSGEIVGNDVAVDLRDSHARFYWVGNAQGAIPGRGPKNHANKPASTARFGPHLRDVALNADGTFALLNAFNWDHNLYGMDLRTGQVQFRKRIADHFAYHPQGAGDRFFVQGFDLNSPEGYHLYSVDRDGGSSRRFALPGLPGCQTPWAFTAWIQDQVNQFAVSPSGAWIAAAGNLGLTVWDREGQRLWGEDWSQSTRKSLLLQTQGEGVLLTAHGMTVTARKSTTGQPLWNRTLANSGDIQGLHLSHDGQTLAVRTTNSGGCVYVLQGDQVVGRLMTSADDLSVSPNGDTVVVTTQQQLKVFARETQNDSAIFGLKWLAHGDDQLRFPRVSADGRQIAVCSELGTLSVFSSDGQPLHVRDELGIVVPAWLPGGDLLVAGWTGSVARLDSQYQDRWRTHVRTGERVSLATAIAAGDRIPTPPTTRETSWIAAESTVASRPNLLQPNQLITRWLMGDQQSIPLHPTNDLVDGNLENSRSGDTKHEPWLSWYDHGMIESGWRGDFSLVVDTFNKQLRVDSITFVEDAAHPESWLRDMRCEYWDADAERWVFTEYLTSDSAIHRHSLKRPIEAARIRFVKADGHAWPSGNIRLQELMLHGDVLGASHPDVVARRPVAVLFDENVASVKGSYEHGHNYGLKFATGADAFSGGNYITMPGNKNFSALWQPPFGHMTPNWWFEVVEKPSPGQYRYLQFSVKSLSAETRGVTVRVAPSHYGGVAVSLGEPTKSEGAVDVQESSALPLQWHTVTVDLWEHLPENQRGKPFNIGAMTLGTVGGPVAIDKIRLGRTLDDLK